MSAADFLAMFAHFAVLSCLSIGGAMSASPEMHRYLVDTRGWIDHGQFTDSIAIAQAAPGPNILFVTLLGWQVAGLAGALAATVGILLPSSLITLAASRWKRHHDDARLVRAMRLGLSPIAIGLTLSAGWVVAAEGLSDWRLLALTVATVAVVARSRLNPLWLIAAGAALGAAGWI